MINLFTNSGKGGEEPEDFVLFNSDNGVTPVNDNEDVAETKDDTEFIEETDSIENTNSIDVRAVSAALTENDSAQKKQKKAKRGRIGSFVGAHRVLFICVAVVLVAAIVSSGVFGVLMLSNPLRGYAQVAATKENIMRTMETSGTLASGDRYEITSLVAGKVTYGEYEVGDEVAKDEVLYKIDDTEAKLAVERAKNELEKASDTSLNSANNVRITSTEAGVVQTLSIKTGSTVSAGNQVGTIKRTDGTIAPIFAYMSGQVTVVSVRVGQTLSAGQLIATVNTKSNNEKNSTYDKKSSEIDLQSVQRQLENYTIKSPVTGIVIEKNAKPGDNVGITDSDKPMMVILDTSTLNFTFSVDEYRLREIEKGQSVIINTESIPDTTFSGVVSSVSTEGRAGEDGNALFDVKVVISDPGELKSGMNITAKVVLSSVTNVISVPEDALMESNGQEALVFVRIEEETGDEDLSETIENELNFPWIKVPAGCELRKVKYGISDGERVQILSGLKLGDIIVYDADEEKAELVPSTVEIDEDEFLEDDLLEDEEGLETDAEIEAGVRKEIEKLLEAHENL